MFLWEYHAAIEMGLMENNLKLQFNLVNVKHLKFQRNSLIKDVGVVCYITGEASGYGIWIFGDLGAPYTP